MVLISTMNMKKGVTIVLILTVFIPQVVFAAWWNPFSWFNHWVFLRGNNDDKKTQFLEERIAELEKKVVNQEQETTNASNQTETVDTAKTTAPVKIVEQPKTEEKITPKITAISTPTGDILSASDLVKKVSPSVLLIKTPKGYGSGSVIDGKYILTNAHVVENFLEVEAMTSSNRGYTTTLEGIDEFSDLALLYAPSLNLPSLSLGNSDNMQSGNDVFTFGFPLSATLESMGADAKEVSFKEGTLSRKVTFSGIPYLEMSAEIHPGNSGGPLVNDKGEIVGTNTLKVGLGSDQIRWAIAINYAKPIIAEMKKGMILRINKVSNANEQKIHYEFSQKYNQVSSNETLISAINESYSDSYFKYLNSNLYTGGDSIKKSYLENLIKGIYLIIPGIEYLKFINQELNNFFATNQNVTGAVTNSYQENVLTNFESYNLKKISEYSAKVSEIYTKKKEIEQGLDNLSGTNPTTIKSQEQYLLGLINYVASEKNTLLDKLSDKKFF